MGLIIECDICKKQLPYETPKNGEKQKWANVSIRGSFDHAAQVPGTSFLVDKTVCSSGSCAGRALEEMSKSLIVMADTVLLKD